MGPKAQANATDDELRRRQLAGLWLTGHVLVENDADASRFIRNVGFALRYNATASLPLASIFTAVGEKRRAIELTNALLARGEVVETNVIAARLVLVDAAVFPAVYALRKRNQSPKLSSKAERALELIRQEGYATSGEVRRFLGVAGLTRPDPGDRALEELQRELLIDRGPSSVPKRGIPYLSPEGYPYRILESAHADLVCKGSELMPEEASRIILETYLRTAVFAAPRKLTSMFKLLLGEDEMRAAIDWMLRAAKAHIAGKWVVFGPE
jgi:hypothetical protein